MAINLRRLFLDYQNELLSSLWKYRSVDHPGEKGDLTEGDWRELLRRHLPRRYDVSTGFVVDCLGSISLQIDAIIHDRYFSPLFFDHHDILFVPAESVYAVFEIKQEVDATTFEHACDKAESVRKLARTAALFPSVAAQHGPGKPFEILAGILCTRSGWSPALQGTLAQKLKDEVGTKRRLDMGCVLQHGSFAFEASQAPFEGPGFPKNAQEEWGELLIEEAEGTLVRFFMFLWQGLQRLGNVPAIDFRAYAAMPDKSNDQELLVHAEELERIVTRLPRANSKVESFRKQLLDTAEQMRKAVEESGT